jgi:RNA polymerase sigma-B factor
VSHPSERRPRTDLEDLDALALDHAQAWTGASSRERERLRAQLICRCLPFAGRMARRFAGRGEPYEDLQQVARIGLINAIDRYDPSRGSFTAFTLITISGEIKRHFRDKTWGLRVSRQMQNLSLEILKADAALAGTLSRQPTTAEVAAYVGVTESEILQGRLCGQSHRLVSFNVPTSSESTLQLGDMLGEPDQDLESMTDTVAVHDLMRMLPPRLQRILVLRFYGNLNQAQIAAACGISQMHVSRLLTRALDWLRASLMSDRPQPWLPGDEALQAIGIRIRIDRAVARVVVRVSGEADRDCADQLRHGLHAAVAAAGRRRLTIDLEGVSFADAGAIAVLEDACRTAALAHVGVTVTGMQAQVAAAVVAAGRPPLARAVAATRSDRSPV